MLAQHRVTEHHEKSTNDTQVPEEKVEVEDETIAKSLNNHDGQEPYDSKLGVLFENDRARADQHDLRHKVHGWDHRGR